MVRLHIPTNSPIDPHPKSRHATQSVRPGCPISPTIDSISHRRRKRQKVSNPSPRTRETMATRSRSTSSRLAFGNPKPRNMERVGITDAKLNQSRGPKVSRIRCGGICLQCQYRFQCCRKGRAVCRIIEPVSPGYSCRLKQEPNLPFVDVDSSPKCYHRRHRRVRPHHHAHAVLLKLG